MNTTSNGILANTNYYGYRTTMFLVVSHRPHTDWEKVHFQTTNLTEAEAFAINYTGPEELIYLKKVFVSPETRIVGVEL